MARRPVFRVLEFSPYVRDTSVEFKYHAGCSTAQRRRSYQSLHAAYLNDYPRDAGAMLEISSLSENPLGVQLSAFNLRLILSDGHAYPLECVYQASKCFANGTRCPDLLHVTAREAKMDERLRSSGPLSHFELEGLRFPLEPRTLFYDWLYISALRQHPELSGQLLNYRAFTDIVYNPEKSSSCQARAAARFVGLTRAGKLEEALASPEAFRHLAYV